MVGSTVIKKDRIPLHLYKLAKVLKIITSVGTSGNGFNLSGRLFEKDRSETLEMASKHMKKMPASLANREMQIQTI